jgi:putative RNA 2'-phosphotransferase
VIEKPWPSMRKDLVTISKYLSLILRHKPETVGLSLSAEGWIEISKLLKACEASGKHISREMLQEVVEQNDKQRFVIQDGCIRASQGHSLKVNLDPEPVKPPKHLFHGTAERNLVSIAKHGLDKKSRLFVHLSKDKETAQRVGARYGKPVVLKVASQRMYADGHEFFLSQNGVWLTNRVPVGYLENLTSAA